jgi:hypothetical protein
MGTVSLDDEFGALTAAVAPPAPVQPTLRPPPALTLIGISRTLLGDVSLDGDMVRFEGGGVEFQPLPCSSGFVPFSATCDEDDLDGIQRQAPLRFDPVYLWAGVECSAASWGTDEGRRRAEQFLLIDQHRQLEREFWTGEVIEADNLPNLYLAMDGEVTELESGTATPLSRALSTLQQELADCGGRGMIHATVRTASLWAALGLIRRNGGLLVDPFDNVIVPGVGYPGTAPGGALDATGDTAWAYATGIVDTRLGDIFIPSNPWELFDLDDNSQKVIAQRAAVAYWDGCCHLGINVDHAETGVGGAGGDVDGGSP